MKKKITFKQIVAACGIVLLLGMYIVSIVLACLAKPGAADMFMASIAMTVGLPILLYVILMFDRLAKGDKEKGANMKMSELRKYNKRMAKGEDPEALAKEIEEKYGATEDEEEVAEDSEDIEVSDVDSETTEENETE